MALPLKIIGIVPNSTTNAAFRAWGNNVESLFANSGMLKVTTAGEIDWVTVAAPAAGSAEAGFQIWQFNDALQATAPVYFRLGYGSSGAAARPSLRLTLGANVSGNAITTVGGAAPTTANTTFDPNSSSTNANLISFACGNASSIVLALWMVQTQPTLTTVPAGGPPWTETGAIPLVLSIERTHDANGADTTDGVYIFGHAGNRLWHQVYWSGTTGQGTATYEGTAGILLPSIIGFQSGGDAKLPNQVGYFPLYFTKAGGVLSGPSLNILGTMQDGPAGAAGFGIGSGMNGELRGVPIANATHYFVGFCSDTTGNLSPRGGNSNSSFMTRFE